MTKKKTKKNQKTAQSATPAVELSKKEDEIDMLEDIKRDEDLYISESDVTNISNFIRTTNKSFNSLGNTVVEKFNGRCSLAILHALIALFDQDSEEREDVIRRLNIIYIVWRLPEIEAELKLKPSKSMNDVYSHPFSTFLFFAERLEQHTIEASLARIIVTNNVAVIEKLTAPDFIQKASKLDVYQVDMEAYEKWEEANSAHWPEITEEMVSLSKAMRELGSERKDYEAGMAEAFYPLVHNPPTMLPPRMMPLEHEDPGIANYRNTVNSERENNRMATVLYSLSADPNIQQNLLDAFTELEQTVDEYQGEIFSGMTNAEKAEAQLEFGEEMATSSDSEIETELETDSEEEAEADFRAMTAAAAHMDFNDKTIEGCVDRILAGTTLTTSKTEMMNLFVKNCNLSHPQYERLLASTRNTDDNIVMMCKTNVKFASSFLVRNALSEHGGTCELFKRYIRICESLNSVVHALEIVLRLAKEFMEVHKMTPEHRNAVLNFVRHTVKSCEESENPPARTIRLVAMLVKKLLRENVVSVDEIAADVKPFTLKFTENRECTALYRLITGIQSGQHGGNSMLTTTTTTTSVNTNSATTMTTTTVIKQSPTGSVVKSSKKVLFRHQTPSTPSNTPASSKNTSPGNLPSKKGEKEDEADDEAEEE